MAVRTVAFGFFNFYGFAVRRFLGGIEKIFPENIAFLSESATLYCMVFFTEHGLISEYIEKVS